MADFNFYLNRQGVKGRKGDQGEQGFSPIISVKTQTANEYVLTVQNEDGSFDTPNLRGNAIANTGGTYLRYNQATEEMYTGYADIASYEQQGEVLFATYEQLENGGEEFLGVTSADVYDFVNSKVQDLGFNALAQTLVAGTNITLDVDDENKEITINATGGFDPSVQNTFAGYQTFETETGSTANTIYKAIEVSMPDNTSIVIGRNGDSQSLIAGIGRRLRLGTTRTDISAVDFFQTSTTYFPSVCISNIAEPSNNVTEGDYHPLFNDLNLTFGTGLTVATSGSGTGKKYTVTSSVDLTNYVTTNTNQTITGTKTFQYGLKSYSSVKTKDLRIWDGGQREQGYLGGNDAGTTTVTLSSKGILQFKNWSNGASGGYTARTVDLADILTTSEITTTIDSQSTNSEVPSAAAVYSIVGDIESLLYNINSGNGQ